MLCAKKIAAIFFKADEIKRLWSWPTQSVENNKSKNSSGFFYSSGVPEKEKVPIGKVEENILEDEGAHHTAYKVLYM